MSKQIPMDHPLGVGLAVLLIAFAGRGTAQALEQLQLQLPDESLVTTAMANRLNQAKPGFSPGELPLDSQTAEICLRYANALAGCFIEENLLPSSNWRTAPAVAAAAGKYHLQVDHFTFDGTQFLCTGSGETHQACTEFAQALEQTGLFPGLQLTVDPLPEGKVRFHLMWENPT